MNRIEPALPVSAVKTYGISAPLSTHWRKATCVEVDCPNLAGWVTLIRETAIPPADDVSVKKMMALADRDTQRAYYIRHISGRSFVESRDESGATVFDFGPGQECFEEHRIRIDRPELFIVRGGDHRGNPRRENLTHDRPEFWVEDFAAHQDNIVTRVTRG